MRVRVSYLDDRLRLELLDCSMGDFLKSALWKVRLPLAKRLRPRADGQTLVFPVGIGVAQCRDIVSSLERAERWGLEAELDESYERSVNAWATHLEERARTGLAIKAHDPSMRERFLEFSRTVNERMVRCLRERQMWDAFFMCVVGHAANFSVPGSGKTAAVLGTYTYLHARGLADRVVVVSPKNAFGSWRDEWDACFGEKDPCRSLCFHDGQWSGVSRSARMRELNLGYRKYNLILLNYEAAAMGEALHHAVEDKSLLVFDEVHKVKRVGGRRAQAALDVAEHAKYTIALTGTPIPNSYLDVYNLLHILYPADYDWYFGFRTSALKNPDQRVIDNVNASMQPFFCRTNKRMLGVPEPNPDNVVSVPASDWEAGLLHAVREELSQDPLALIIRVLQLESDPSMLLSEVSWSDLHTISDADDEADAAAVSTRPLALDSRNREAALSGLRSSKMGACLELVERLVAERKTVIVWCIFTQTMENLLDAFDRMNLRVRKISGAVPMDERSAILGDFKAGCLDVLVTNPHTLAESVSLHMACHDAIYFEYSYNLVHLLQSKDRINRLGLPDGQYTQYHFLQTVFPGRGEEGWSLDRNIYDRLNEKEQTMIDAIDRGVLEPGSTDERDWEIVFQGLFDDDAEEEASGYDA